MVVELAHQRGVGQRLAHILARLQRQPQVFLHQLDHEAGREIPRRNPRSEIGQLPRTGRARADRLQHPLRVHTRLLRQRQRFADPQQRARNRHLVAELHRLARADRTAVRDRLAHRLEDRAAALQRVGLAADHDRERPRLRARIAARNRRVKQLHATLRQPRPDLPRHRRADRAHVDHHRARRQPADRRTLGLAARSVDQHLPHIAAVGHDRDQHIRRFGDGARRLGRDRAQRRAGVDARPAAVPDRRRVARRDQVGDHRTPHDAETDKAHPFAVRCHANPSD